MENANQKILITGATGFIGSALCAMLTTKDLDVRALVRNTSSTGSSSLAFQGIEIAVGDLIDQDSLHLATREIHTVIHLAGIAHVNNVSKQKYQDTIVEGSANLFRACLANGVKKIIFLSSALAESAEKKSLKTTPYGQAKLEAEKCLVSVCEQADIEYCILRPVNVYGAGMQGNIARMIAWIDRGILPPLPRVDTRLSLLGVNDLVNILVSLIEMPKIKSKPMLLAESEPYHLLAIEREIYQCLEKKIPTRRTPHMLVYTAAALAGFLAKLTGLFGISTPISGISLRTYSNLVNHSVYECSPEASALNLTWKDNLLEQLPAIIEATNSTSN